MWKSVLMIIPAAVLALFAACREDEVVVPTEYDILPVTVPEGSDVVGMYLLNEGNMVSKHTNA